ncbi:hypothetical protein LTR37_008266 [Vermiconidia calcicola]|uniref:Uncharacterized protein n=1 Tax=Vermiconidia calcicola TaxID=1690605 RepID=A0ACC3NB69_9PEZI|nr:hypothetical protein LTR37_008266 [Vermiconidia calcicola]
MKFSHILPLVAASSAFVLPSQETFEEVAIEENHRDTADGWYERVVSEKDRLVSDAEELFDDVKEIFEDAWSKVVDNSEDVRGKAVENSEDVWSKVVETSRNALDEALERGSDASDYLKNSFNEASSSFQSWMDTVAEDIHEDILDDGGHHGGHHGRPAHPPQHGKPNMTVYQLINESKYSEKLAKLINEFPDLVDQLNSTNANYTVFAPTDKALDKIPDDAPEPSKEQLREFLEYHIVPDFAPAKKVLVSHTFPTLLVSDSLGSEPHPQRISRQLSLKGLTINFFARVVAVDIIGTNGVIHGLDTPLLPPFKTIKTVDLFPTVFSTLELGLGKTGLLDMLNTTDHAGGTFFAPDNFAFEKLGPKVNAFLFSQYGLKYLKALLEYHVVPDNTLYSDAFYKASSSAVEVNSVPKGYYHVDLPTLLKDRSLSVDIARYGGFISIKVNAFANVAVQDAVTKDGVIQVMTDVIVPPKKLGNDLHYWTGEEMSVEDLKERLEPFVAKSDL